MPEGAAAQVREATAEDAADVARLLDAFNREYDEPTPGPEVLAPRLAELISAGTLLVLLAGDGPDGLAQLRFYESVWTETSDTYVEELYVVPELRGRGIGRALLEAAIAAARARGSRNIALSTSTDDRVAIALYESAGFTNLEGGPGGPSMLYYERDLPGEA